MCSNWYRKRQLEKRRTWSRNANAAKERKRLELGNDIGSWTTLKTLIVGMSVSPDGRHVAMTINGRHYICGTERAMRAKLAKVMYKTRGAEIKEEK